jgi:hypothetical protein
MEQYNHPLYSNSFHTSDTKEVLIKSVAQAIPTYVMGVFKLPATLCEEMEQLIRYFWGGGGGWKQPPESSLGGVGENLAAKVDLGT